MVDGQCRAAETELEFAEGANRPRPIEVDPECFAQHTRLCRVSAALGLSSLARLEPGESCERTRKLAALTGFAREPECFVVLDRGAGPIVTRGVITRHAAEQPRKDAESRLRTGGVDRLLDQRAFAAGFAQPQRPHDQPRKQSRV